MSKSKEFLELNKRYPGIGRYLEFKGFITRLEQFRQDYSLPDTPQRTKQLVQGDVVNDLRLIYGGRYSTPLRKGHHYDMECPETEQAILRSIKRSLGKRYPTYVR